MANQQGLNPGNDRSRQAGYRANGKAAQRPATHESHASANANAGYGAVNPVHGSSRNASGAYNAAYSASGAYGNPAGVSAYQPAYGNGAGGNGYDPRNQGFNPQDNREIQKRRKSRRRWTVVLVIALIVLVGSLGALGVIGFSYFQGQQAYTRVAESANLSISEASDLDSISIDWDALRATNPDIVAWIYIPNTNISYPVVKGTDDEYYLYHDFEGTQGGVTNNGCIFMHYENKSDFSDQGTFLFGHHLNDGTMFSAISDEDNFENQRTVYVLTPTVNMRLKAFALVHCAYNDPLLQTSFSGTSGLKTYLDDIIGRAAKVASDAPDTSTITKFIALSTCDNQISNGRYVMYCAIDEVGTSK